MFHWAWSWLTFKRGARLITGEVRPLPPVTTIGADGEVAAAAGGRAGRAHGSRRVSLQLLHVLEAVARRAR